MNTTSAPKVYGMPDQHLGPLPIYYQGNTNECAIYAQWNVLMDYGKMIDEKSLVEQAKAHGWFTDEGGTPAEDLGKLLELNGIPCNRMIDGNRYNLIHELAQGKRVIVTVDSSELWRENTVLAKLWEGVKDVFGSGEDHALVVTGIDTSVPDNIQVILTDSGTGHRTISYPLDQFEDAWTDGGCKMIVPSNPPPDYSHLNRLAAIGHDRLSNFDYEAGHISSIGNTPYDEWQLQHADLLDGCTVRAIADSPDMAEILHNSTEEFCPFAFDGNVPLECRDPEHASFWAEDTNNDGVTDRIHVDLNEDGVADISYNVVMDDPTNPISYEGE